MFIVVICCCWRRRRRLKNQIAKTMRARATTPPTTPPAIAPTGVDDCEVFSLLFCCPFGSGFGVALLWVSIEMRECGSRGVGEGEWYLPSFSTANSRLTSSEAHLTELRELGWFAC